LKTRIVGFLPYFAAFDDPAFNDQAEQLHLELWHMQAQPTQTSLQDAQHSRLIHMCDAEKKPDMLQGILVLRYTHTGVRSNCMAKNVSNVREASLSTEVGAHLVWQHWHVDIYIFNELDKVIPIKGIDIIIEAICILIPILLHTRLH
jgi:hypothetical protein